MKSLPKWRKATVLAGVLGVVAGVVLVGLGMGRMLPGGTDAETSGVLEIGELGICLDEALVSPDAGGISSEDCTDCPKKLHGQPCFRISCDPCCYRCQGDPIPRCY